MRYPWVSPFAGMNRNVSGMAIGPSTTTTNLPSHVE